MVEIGPAAYSPDMWKLTTGRPSPQRRINTCCSFWLYEDKLHPLIKTLDFYWKGYTHLLCLSIVTRLSVEAIDPTLERSWVKKLIRLCGSMKSPIGRSNLPVSIETDFTPGSSCTFWAISSHCFATSRDGTNFFFFPQQ